MEILDEQNAPKRALQYAGFWIRVAAFIIDAIVVYAAVFLVAAIVSGLVLANGTSAFDEDNSGAVFVVVALIYLVLLVAVVSYFALMESSDKQATLGKMAVGIKVGKSDGEKISFANAIGRYFSKMLSGMILYIGYIMVGFDEKKQGLHDKIANTYVFYK
jgi:uncharacterized RDD family membrane protein YckC